MKPNKINTVLAILSILLIISFVSASESIPVKADPGILKWALLDTPGAFPHKNDIVTPSEVNRICIGDDNVTAYAIDIPNRDIYKSLDSGITWKTDIKAALLAAGAVFPVWNIAIAPGDPSFVAVVTSDGALPRKVYISTDGGVTWNTTMNSTILTFPENISSIDISAIYGTDSRDIAVGTRTGGGAGKLYTYTLKATGLSSWVDQTAPPGDIIALKLSPSYASDSGIIIVTSTPGVTGGTYLNSGQHDSIANTTAWGVLPVELTMGGVHSSAKANQIVNACISLPSDFNGDNPTLRRFYISYDDIGFSPSYAGIYRVDDNTGYWLMPATSNKRISSIAYFGTYKSGKLMAGEVLGSPCSATVMTWFTDAPMTCPVTCWYQSVKPPTGAAGTNNCFVPGYGNAQVAWSPDGKVAYVGTASSSPLIAGPNWPIPYLTGEDLDESAFSISRDNGLTWNQLSLIDTLISNFTDIAPSPDRSVIYLASSNNSTNCSGFDSVWRSKSTPVGFTWERILCRATTSEICTTGQTNSSILRLAGDKANGQAVTWAAIGTKLILHSTDYGDTWNKINPGFNVQDIAVEDSSTLYVLSPAGQVQKFISNGNGSISLKLMSTGLDSAYSIATAYTGVTPDNYKGHIIVGSAGTGDLDIAFSEDSGKTFTLIKKRLPTRDNTMVVASSSYKSDGYILAINSGGMYAWGIYSGDNNWETWWGGEQSPSPVTGLSISRSYGFYLSTPASLWGPATPYVRWSAALAGLDPLISLGTQPTTRLRICGGLEYGQPITVYAIDQRSHSLSTGGVWYYVDCLSWEGPSPIEPVSLNPVSFDPVSGRAAEINLRWNPVCLSRGYQIQIAKDIDFNMVVADIGSEWGTFYTPYDLDKPALVIPAGGGTITDFNGNTWTMPILALEAGHTYYWKVRVRDVATGDSIDSPWSWRESFIIRQGFRVTTPYYGPQLLAPDNHYCCSANNPICFSWSPYKETDSYKLQVSTKADMSNPIIAIEVPLTAYQYDGKLNASTNYFWRVKAVKPYPSEWSAIFSFTSLPEKSDQPPNSLSFTPMWVFVVILCCLLLILIVVILIFYYRHLT